MAEHTISEDVAGTEADGRTGDFCCISFIQINLNHCVEASRVLVHKHTLCNISVSIVQEPWIRGLKAAGYRLYEGDPGELKLKTTIWVTSLSS